MTIVTTACGEERAGCLVGFATQCSIRPPLFAVWLSRKNRTTRLAQQASSLLVHFLGGQHRELAELFGSVTGDEGDKFSRCRWERGPDGLPRLSDCDRWVAGRIIDRFETGDHVGHILEPFDAGAGDWTGQFGFQEAKDFEPGHPA
ncbi:MAG: flavin reductase family protein [Actinomycetota bacterium]|nr:flavin reductase family protein [Actinomycetota bacterium]